MARQNSLSAPGPLGPRADTELWRAILKLLIPDKIMLLLLLLLNKPIYARQNHFITIIITPFLDNLTNSFFETNNFLEQNIFFTQNLFQSIYHPVHMRLSNRFGTDLIDLVVM